MLISTKGRYALRIMIDLAENSGDGYVPLKEMAARQDISEKYLESILKVLVQNNLLAGLRGKGRLPPDQSAAAVHRWQHSSPDRRQPGPGNLPGAGQPAVCPHG